MLMLKEELPPVPIIHEDVSEFYAITTDIFHVYHFILYLKCKFKEKVVGFSSFKTQPNLMCRNFKVALCHSHETCPRPRSGNGNPVVLVMIILDSRSTDCQPDTHSGGRE